MELRPIPEMIDGLPNFCGAEAQVEQVTRDRHPVYLHETDLRLDRLRAAFAVALHMHQPLIPAGGPDLRTAEVISNLDYMVRNPGVGDSHNAPVFAECYARTGDLIAELVDAGRSPRIMLDYSGELLYGLPKMGRGDVLDRLRGIACDPHLRRYAEWLGTMWGHAVAPSTPPPDFVLHLRAWQQQFAAVFGWEALGRVRGFSPPEMHLPNHPDVAFEYVKALKECGYRWLLVQEHSVEDLDGHGLRERHLPHRLVARNSCGEEMSIVAVIKTQGSDTKLVGQMQPFYEAQTLQRREVAGVSIPPLVTQIGDGENGGVMMNEFPSGLPAGRLPPRQRGGGRRERHRVPRTSRAGGRHGGHAARLPADPPGGAVRTHHRLGAGRRRQGPGGTPARAARLFHGGWLVDKQHQLGPGI